MQPLPLPVLSTAVALGLLYASRMSTTSAPPPRHLLLGPLALLMIAATLTALVSNDATAGADRALLLQVGQHTPSALSQLLAFATHTGSAPFLTILISWWVIGMLVRRDLANALLLALSGLGGALLVVISKLLIARPRPELWDTAALSTYSFPSGHTLGTAACAGALVIVLARRHPRQRSLWVTLGLSWLLLVGLSRLTLGVHWPSDVLAGACAGLALPLLLSRLPGCRQPA